MEGVKLQNSAPDIILICTLVLRLCPFSSRAAVLIFLQFLFQPKVINFKYI